MLIEEAKMIRRDGIKQNIKELQLGSTSLLSLAKRLSRASFKGT